MYEDYDWDYEVAAEPFEKIRKGSKGVKVEKHPKENEKEVRAARQLKEKVRNHLIEETENLLDEGLLM